MVSGGAALNPMYIEKFDELGIMILNGYGLTECSPLVAVNREVNNIQGSVGTIIKDDKVKIDKILTYGENAKNAEFLLFNFGWDKYWGNDKYFGNYPVLSDEVVDFIIKTKILNKTAYCK